MEETAEAAAGLNEDWRWVEAVLPEGWREQARELGALRRARGFEDAAALLRTLLIHLAEGCGLRQTAERARLAGLAEVSDVALLKRLKAAGAWFEWMAQGLRRETAPADPDGLAGVLAGRRLRVVDGSVVREPGPTGSQWRLHYAIGLPDLHCQEVHLGPQAQGETLKRFQARPGDIFIADRGYAHAGGVAHVVARGADVLVRLNLVTLPLYDPHSGARWDLLKACRSLQAGRAADWPVCVHPSGQAPIQGRLCAIRKSAVATARAQTRVRRESLRGQCQLQPQTLEAAAYIWVFTTLKEPVSAEQVLALYRLRWQIELAFKRLKSLIQLGHLKKHDAQAARSWLQGKLLVAFLVARLIAQAERFSPWGYDTPPPPPRLSVA